MTATTNTTTTKQALTQSLSSSSRWIHTIQEKSFGFVILIVYLYLSLSTSPSGTSWTFSTLTNHTNNSDYSNNIAIGDADKDVSQPPSTSLSSSSSSSLLSVLVLICSTINIISHSLVVFHQIKTVCVGSILVGVGFDVLSSMIYLWYWMTHIDIRMEATDDTATKTVILPILSDIPVTLITIIMVWNFIIHVRALFLAQNMDRLECVVQSAYNNLEGYPGLWGTDHIFAYTDIGNHIWQWYNCVVHLLRNDGAGSTLSIVAFGTISTVTLLAAFYIGFLSRKTRSQSLSMEDLSTGQSPQERESRRRGLLLTRPEDDDDDDTKTNSTTRLRCKCDTCQGQTAFTLRFYPIKCCQLWLYSFDEILDEIQKVKKKKKQKLI